MKKSTQTTKVLTAIAAADLLSITSAPAAEGEASRSAKEFLHGESNFAALRLKSSATAAELEAVIVTEARVSLPFSARLVKKGVLKGAAARAAHPSFHPGPAYATGPRPNCISAPLSPRPGPAPPPTAALPSRA